MGNIGTYGPVIMIAIAIWRLYYLPKYLLWFLVFLSINESLNLFAKQIIKQPRPGQQMLKESSTRPDYILPSFIEDLRSVVAPNFSQFGSDSQNANYYGMPSGHAQHALFIMSFLWLVNPSWAVLCVCVVITGIIFMERYDTKRHSIEQLLAGGMTGIVVAYVSVTIFRKYYE